MHTITHILAWLPSEYMGLGDSTPALHLFYPNLIYLHVGWATTATFRSLHYILITHHSSSVLPTLCIFLCRCQFIFRVETVTDGRNTSNIYKGTVSKPNTFSWTSYLTLLLTNKFVLVMFQAISELKTFFFLSDIGSDSNWGSVWPMGFVSVPPFFCNIVYKLSNFVFYTELNARLPIVMIIKQLN